MIYRGFNIQITESNRILRYKSNNQPLDACSGVAVEIYDQADDGLVERIGDTSFAVGYEISDFSDATIERAVRKYVDEHIISLDCIRNEVISERKNDIVGRLVTWIGEDQSGEELYNTLSENIGMTDDEIRECGYKSLVPYFDKEEYAQTIADYMIYVGTDNTTTGNWHFSFEELGNRYAINLSEDVDMLDMILEALYKNGDIISEIGIYADEFDLTFYLNQCPYVDEDEIEELYYYQKP